ncbi:LPXTG cell wall anchor domain-containing protein [Clostridium perfringens]|nr:LPXTG cell wall anchor domain-containing protein [Clostridium perfringens]
MDILLCYANFNTILKQSLLNKNTETNTYDISVENVPRIILPETGGSGTSKFSFIGITLLAAVLSLVSTTEFVLKEREN